MKSILSALAAIWVVVGLCGCGSDGPGNGNPGDEPLGTVTNANRNVVSASTPHEVTRLEFPRIHGTNSIVLVHHTSGAHDVSYSCEWDYQKKSQRWSCCAMTSKTIKGGAGYTGDFREDPDLPTAMRFSDTSSMYSGSGFTRGHIIASADVQYSREANQQTFYYTNMQPQYDNFNAGETYEGIWVRMEKWVRKKAQSLHAGDTLFVCKGGTIDDESQILKRVKNQLIVPRYFYMALLMKSGGQYKAIGLWAEHKSTVDNSKVASHAITIDELERLTGIDFFCNLPDDIEHKVQGSISLISWGL